MNEKGYGYPLERHVKAVQELMEKALARDRCRAGKCPDCQDAGEYCQTPPTT